MKISIIVPVYNGEKYFAECIQSILDQSFTDIEVIVINDGSTDGSLPLIKGSAQNDSRVVVINQKNKGVSAARNAGLSKARGDYIMFVDADDYIARKDALELLIDSAKENSNPDVVCFRRVGDTRNRKAPSGYSRLNNSIIGRMIVDETINTLWDKLYKKSIIKENSIKFPVGIRMAEDLLFNVQYFCEAKTIGFFDEELYYYREDNQESATKKYMPNKYDDLMYVNRKMSEIIDNRSKAIGNALSYIRIKNVLSCVRDLHNEACALSEADKKKLARQYKSDNGRMIVFGYGVEKMLISIVYSYMGASGLLRLTSLFRRYSK